MLMSFTLSELKRLGPTIQFPPVAPQAVHPTDRRCGSLWFKVLLLSMVLAPGFYLRSRLEAQPPVWPVTVETFNAIEAFMPEDEVDRLLGGPGLAVAGEEWPVVGEAIPEVEKLHKLLSGTIVRWKKWSDPTAPDRWIAVGFSPLAFDGRDATPKAIAKRKNGL
jgi:hypothetical protein